MKEKDLSQKNSKLLTGGTSLDTSICGLPIGSSNFEHRKLARKANDDNKVSQLRLIINKYQSLSTVDNATVLTSTAWKIANIASIAGRALLVLETEETVIYTIESNNNIQNTHRKPAP